MNILHLNPRLMLTCGVTRSIMLIMENMKNCRHYATAFGGDALDKFTRHDLQVLRLPGLESTAFIPIHVFLIAKMCRQYNIHVLHAHHRYFDFTGKIVSRILGIPLVTTVHSKVFGKKAFSYNADILISPGITIMEHLIRVYSVPPERIRVINNFVKPEDYPNHSIEEIRNERNRLGLRDNQKIVLFIGRMSREKGIDILVNAAAMLQRQRSDFSLLLAGGGEELENIKRFCSANLKEYTFIPPSENVSILYQLADLVVLPSRVDPFPISMIETGLMEKPLLASNVDGISEFITNGEDGLLIKPENEEDLITALVKMLDDNHLRSNLAIKLNKKVISNYTIDKKLPEYFSVYKHLAGGHE